MKRRLPIKKVSTHLDVLQFPAAVAVSPHCLNCSSPLLLTQPDLNSPERLLGVCEQCKHWFLIDLIPDLSAGVLCRLPDIEVIRQLSFDNPSAGTSKRSDDRKT